MYITISMKRRAPSIQKFLRDDGRKFVEAVTAWLNGDPWNYPTYTLPDGILFPYPEPKEVLDEVKGWVRQLLDLNWDLKRWRESHKGEWEYIERLMRTYYAIPVLTDRNGLMLHFECADSSLPLGPHVWAFLELLMNPERERLGQCDRCRKFYASTGRYRRKKFCSRRCARNETASRYIARKRRELRDGRLALAKRLLSGYTRRCGPWKPWLVLKTKVTKNPLTLTFLSRAVGKGDLASPKAAPASRLRSAKA